MSLQLIIVAIVGIALSGVVGILLGKSVKCKQALTTIIVLISSVLGLVGAFIGLFSEATSFKFFYWPTIGGALIGLDELSAFFLIPVFLIGGLGAIYGMGYWKLSEHIYSSQKLQLFWGFLVAGMGLLLIGRHVFSFLMGWELMAISAFILVMTEDEEAECRKSGLVYLIATHISTLTLFGFFALWHYATGSFVFQPIGEGILQPGMLNALFFLALIGFGLKAGMMPLHFWLPGAHASAPSHVSAILSGVMLKMGIYGLIRVGLLLPTPPSLWGTIILTVGSISGLLGVVFAIAQHDIKKLLAYHSVENIGIILIGLGIAFLGRTYNQPEWVALGMAGCLLHVWNHSLFKSLLFFGAGSVLHSTGKRNLDIMGGLGKKMPVTALFFLIGAIAISGIPPLNGFVSELFIYIGLIRPTALGDPHAIGLAMTAPVLAMIGALAAACFVKVYSAVFLGSERSEDIKPVHESPKTMLIPMAILAALCVAIGVFPQYVTFILESIIHQKILLNIIPLKIYSFFSLGFVISIVVLYIWMKFRPKKPKEALTWDCGYAKPTSRMQYTATSFGNGFAIMFEWILHSKVHKTKLNDVMPGQVTFESHVNELVLDRFLKPFFRKTQTAFSWFGRFQQGASQNYILYILIAVLFLMAMLVPYNEWFLPFIKN
ncbi:MAG: hydrogenase [Clostridiales bacterium]|nr:hydrogenase [Clostridiales bacterium]